MKTFLFYDIETTGLNCAFDQILTFAAIRTNLHLKEIGRETVTVRMRHDIVPSPGAFITHRLSPEKLNKGMSELDAALTMHAVLNSPGTISLGYNTLGFDDEFLRFTFYRNLLDPYTHQYANQCSRMDILPIALLYRLFKPDTLNWPVIGGKPSLKLEHISAANSFEVSGKAHDAMADVEATLALSRVLFNHPVMWKYCVGFLDKTEDKKRIGALSSRLEINGETYPLGIMISLPFGSDAGYMAPVIMIGHSSTYSNQSLWLRLDEELKLSGQIEDKKDAYCIRKRYGEPPIILPVLDRFRARLSRSQQETCDDNCRYILDNPVAFDRLADYYRQFRYPEIPDLDVDASLYQSGFFSPPEKKEISTFHSSSLETMVHEVMNFRSERVRSLAMRILFRNLPPEKIAGSTRLNELYQRHMSRVMEKPTDPPPRGFRNDSCFSVGDAKKEIRRIQLELELDDEQKCILEWLDSYLGTSN